MGSLPTRVRAVGVVHPGAATGGSTSAIRADFQRACDLVRSLVNADAGWLPADPGVDRNLAAPFQRRGHPLPGRPVQDLPTAGSWRDLQQPDRRQRAIQLFSAAGRYNAAGVRLLHESTAEGSPDGYRDDAGDLPCEPPRASPTAFDPGPPAGLARLLLGAEPGVPWPARPASAWSGSCAPTIPKPACS